MLYSIDIVIVIIFNSMLVILTTLCSNLTEKEVKDRRGAYTEKKNDLEVQKVIVEFDERRKIALSIVKLKCKSILRIHNRYLRYTRRSLQSHDAFDAHIELNRYKDVICFDESRVVLNNPENNYIHAERIKTENEEFNYIVTQGPMTNTIVDFWRMCLQENVASIVQLCQFFENGEKHCERYYPSVKGTTEKYGNIEVKFVKTKVHPIRSATWTVLEVTDQNNTSIIVDHILVPWWSEKRIPDNPRLTVHLSQWLEYYRAKERPIVAMCNNGAGRSVAFASIRNVAAPLKLTESEKEHLESLKLQHTLLPLPTAGMNQNEFLFWYACLVYAAMIDGFIGEDIAEPWLDRYTYYVREYVRN